VNETAREAIKIYENSVESLLLLAAEEKTYESALGYYQQAAAICSDKFKVR
jgi:hypothetical protein